MAKKLTTEEWVAKAKEKHGDAYDYSKVVYTNNKAKVKIICPTHGEFIQEASSHSKGAGCPKCADIHSAEKRKLTLNDWIAKARNKHGDKYDYSKVKPVLTSEKVEIICPIHGTFWQKSGGHLQGMGCPACGVQHIKNSISLSTNDWIAKAKEKHGDKFDYSKVNYINKNTPIDIICPVHGVVSMLPVSHIGSPTGCTLCSKEQQRNIISAIKTVTVDDFLKRAKKLYGEDIDYSKVDYIDLYTEVTLICKKHGEYTQKPVNHLRGKGCKECALESMKATKKKNGYTTESWVAKASAIHNNKYKYPRAVYVNNKEPIIVTCEKHGDFKIRPTSHLDGVGCAKCAIDNRRGGKFTTEEWIAKAKKKHGDSYDYSKTNYINAKTKVKIICPLHGEFEQFPTSHLSGVGCAKCAVEKMTKPSMTTDEYIAKAKKKHGDKYGYDKTKYTGVYNKVIITCPTHGDVLMLPNSHLTSETGCSICSKELTDSKQTSTKEEWIAKARKNHGNKYDYSKVNYINKSTKVEIICPIHGSFWQIAGEHVRAKAAGCPKCNVSKGEKKISEILDKYNIKYKTEYVIPNSNTMYRYDFYLPELNILIEYDGELHFIPVKYFGGVDKLKDYQEKDVIKNNLAKQYGYNLIRIKYDKFDMLEEYLLFRISKYFKYRVGNNWYKDFLELCRGENLPGDTKLKDVEKYLIYKKDEK